MTMTDEGVRTYAVGDEVADGEYARAANPDDWCDTRVAPGYICSIAKGHAGPQHVAVGAGRVQAVLDRDTSGDEPKRYAAGDMAGLPMRASEQGVPYCGESADPVGSYYTCSLPEGHDGPQHLTIDGASGRVVAGKDVPVPIVEQPTPQVLAERLATAVEVNANLDRQVRELRDELATVRNERRQLQSTHDEFRQTVVDTAMELARRHDWCSVVQRGLEDMGLGDLLEREYRVQVTVTATRTATVTVTAREGEDAWRKVDNMSASELSDLIDQGDSSYRFYGSGEWEHESHDAATDVDEV